jgi:hypothetical protein
MTLVQPLAAQLSSLLQSGLEFYTFALLHKTVLCCKAAAPRGVTHLRC